MTMNILGIREKIKPDDTADALLLFAICTAHSSHNDRLKEVGIMIGYVRGIVTHLLKNRAMLMYMA